MLHPCPILAFLASCLLLLGGRCQATAPQEPTISADSVGNVHINTTNSNATVLVNGRDVVAELRAKVNSLEEENKAFREELSEIKSLLRAQANATSPIINDNSSNSTASNDTLLTIGEAKNIFYTKSYMNEAMVFPVNSGAVRRIPLSLSDWLGPENYQAPYASEDGGVHGALYQFPFVPPGWYVTELLILQDSTANAMVDVYMNGNSIKRVVGSTNNVVECNTCDSNLSPAYQYWFLRDRSGPVYGGYYEITKA